MTSSRWLLLNQCAVLAAGLWFGCATEARSQVLYINPQGQVVRISGAQSILSDDQGKTWRNWDAFGGWPTLAYSDVVRRGDELLAFGTKPNDGDNGYKGTYVWWSKDEGLTWAGGNRLTSDTDRWQPMNQRVLLTSRGRLIVPIEQLLGAEGPGPNNIGTIYSDDAGRSWKRSPMFGPPPPLPDRPEGFGEPAAVESADGRIWMVFRTRYGHLWQAWSDDGGAHWGKPSATTLVSPLSAVNAKRIPGTRAVIVFWNNSQPGTSTDWNASLNIWKPRSPLVYAISRDNCKSWSKPVVVDPGTAIYPAVCFSDKQMFVAYSSDNVHVVAYDIQSILQDPIAPPRP